MLCEPLLLIRHVRKEEEEEEEEEEETESAFVAAKKGTYLVTAVNQVFLVTILSSSQNLD